MECLRRLSNPQSAAHLFEGWQETLIWSALEGMMGCIWVLSENPKAALCQTGDFLFLAGGADEPETRLLLECWQREKGGFEIITPSDHQCGALIEEIFGAKAKAGKRCAFHKGGEVFDPEALLRMVQCAPAAVAIVPFDRTLYHQALEQPWSRDFVSQFRDSEDFLNRGLGFAAIHNGEMIGGASSYTCYSQGIEIQVETRIDWQRKGIASACCAALILECMKRGLYPSWDAANPVSAALAKKLGYREAGLYPVWYMTHE